jgi:hypothetical protein
MIFEVLGAVLGAASLVAIILVLFYIGAGLGY